MSWHGHESMWALVNRIVSLVARVAYAVRDGEGGILRTECMRTLSRRWTGHGSSGSSNRCFTSTPTKQIKIQHSSHQWIRGAEGAGSNLKSTC